MKLSKLVEIVDGKLFGDGSVDIKGVSALDDALEGTISYIAEAGLAEKIESNKASAFVVPEGVQIGDKPLIVTDNPSKAFIKIVEHFHPRPELKGISSSSFMENSVKTGSDLMIYPNAYVGEGVVIGDRVTIYPGAYIGDGCSLGDDCIIYPNVVIMKDTEVGKRVIIHGGAVIGSDGYGFIREGKKHRKIPQVGKVVIGDDVEIGANCAIDRATLSRTIIKRGTKIDNLVHIAHNCNIGEDVLLAGQVGFAGSVEIGDNVVMAGQAGVSDHVKIGDDAIIGGRSGVTKDIGPGSKVTGYPAISHMDWLRIQKSLEKLPEMRRVFKKIVKKLDELEKSEGNDA